MDHQRAVRVQIHEDSLCRNTPLANVKGFAERFGAVQPGFADLSEAGTRLCQPVCERFAQMLAAGLEDELATLRRKYQLTPDLPSMRCVGYRQAWEAAAGIIPHQELCDRGIFATRQLAKRQITWLSNSFDCEPFDCLDPALNSTLKTRLEPLFG